MAENINSIINDVSKRYGISQETFIKEASINFLLEKKRQLLIELNQIMRKYKVKTINELEVLIKRKQIDEHPAWEDLIDCENLLNDLNQIDNDVRKLS